MAAATDGGLILYASGLGGHHAIQVGNSKRQMIPEHPDHPTVQRWIDGLRELVANRLIRDRGRGSVFDVTTEGYEVANGLKGNAP